MKTTFLIITLLTALSASPIPAADHDKAAASIEVRLAQADLSVTLKQYEKVKLLKADTELQAALLKNSEDKTSERLALEKRIAILQEHADRLRALAVQYDAEIQKRREIALASKGN